MNFALTMTSDRLMGSVDPSFSWGMRKGAGSSTATLASNGKNLLRIRLKNSDLSPFYNRASINLPRYFMKLL